MSSVTDLERKVLAALPGLPKHCVRLDLHLASGQLPSVEVKFYTGHGDCTETAYFLWTGEKFERQHD